jgi:hypothetical protein
MNSFTYKILLLFGMLVGFSFMMNTVEARIIHVSSVSQLKSAIQNLLPGDTIEVNDGNYDFTGNISITKTGTEENPIVIRSKNLHGAVMINKSYFTLKQVAYITIEGFLFRSKDVTAVKTESCNNIRITRNIFRLEETTSNKWVLIGGTWNLSEPNSYNNRIDHNLFEEKHQLGNFITIDGSPEPNAKSSQLDRIDHNHFRNIGPRAGNDMEAIRVGWSEMSLSSGFTIIEHNLFENCGGDPEIISVKTCDNIIRYNTVKSSQGTVCLRHGNRNIVEGNFFLGEGKEGTGGIRFYGDDHKIFNNYFEGLKGTVWDAAITITNGDADYSSSTNWSKHFRPRNTQILFNTFVNNDHNFEIGYTNNGSYSKSPSNIFIANNIVQGSQNELIKIITSPVGFTWLNNIMYPYSTASLGISLPEDQIRVTDPVLILAEGILKLSANSPARDASSGYFDLIIYDIDGQSRDQSKDIGSDEYSTAPVVLTPLTPNDVGPQGGNITIPVELISLSVNQIQTGIQLRWSTASEINNYGFEILRKSIEGDWEAICFVEGKGTTTEISQYSYLDQNFTEGKYSYRLKQIDFDGSYELSETFEIEVYLPSELRLNQNYPNPFNSETVLSFIVPDDEMVHLYLLNSIGERVIDFINDRITAGFHTIKFNAENLASGVFFAVLQTPNILKCVKIIFIK